MGRIVIDRMTINFMGEDEAKLADKFRKLAGDRGINRLLKSLISKYIDLNKNGNSKES